MALRQSKDLRRINNLEDRVFNQEMTTQSLIKRAFELKEKLSDKIEPSSMDIVLQQLWHEHIRTITSTVKQLSRELEAIKHELQVRQFNVKDANHQAQSMEQFTQAGFADLRGRVVRCDSSIAKLAYDLRSVTSTSQLEADRLKQAAENSKSKVTQLENQISDMTRRIDQLLADQDGKMQNMQGSSTQQMEEIDFKIKRVLEDIRMTIDSNKRWAEGERVRIEQQLMQIVQLNSDIAQAKQESFESKILDRVDTLQRSIDDCREECQKCREELKEKAHRNDALNRCSQLKVKMESELNRLKSEYRDGFESVKESINTTNKLINGKVKLVQDELSREISSVRKMVVLL